MATFSTLQESIKKQRERLAAMLHAPLQGLAMACSEVWHDRERLDKVLTRGLEQFPYGKYLYALDTHAIQISSNV